MQRWTRAFSATFTPLRNRNLATYLGGQAISLFGTAMQATAQAWVVWQVSRSTRALGLTIMLSFAPMLALGALAGVWADRLNRRRVLIGTQGAAMLLAFLFALLVQSDRVELWHIYTLALALGCVTAVELPAQTAFVGDLSGVEQVRSAVVLNNMTRQLSRLAGPALAGLVMGSLGVAPAFWMNGASFLPVIASLLLVRVHQVRKRPAARPRDLMREAMAFIGAQPRIQELLLISACVPFFSLGAVGLIPAIVTDYLGGGPRTLGWVEGAAGAGALAGSLLVVPAVQQIRRAGWVVIGALIWVGAWLAALACSGWTWLWVIGMFLGSAGVPVVMTTSTGLLQVLAPPDMKARLISIWMMLSFGMQPFGALLIGNLGHIAGAPAALLLYGAAMVLIGVTVLLLRPGLRQWQPVLPGRH